MPPAITAFTAAPAVSIAALSALLLPLARDSRVRRGGCFGYTVLRGQPDHANDGILCASAEQAPALSFIQDDELNLIEASSEFGERLITGVFDGFAACFGLIHWRSSIPERR